VGLRMGLVIREHSAGAEYKGKGFCDVRRLFCGSWEEQRRKKKAHQA